MKTTCLLESGKDAQTHSAVADDVHDSVSLGSNEMSPGSDENLGVQSRNDNSVGANDISLVYI